MSNEVSQVLTEISKEKSISSVNALSKAVPIHMYYQGGELKSR